MKKAVGILLALAITHTLSAQQEPDFSSPLAESQHYYAKAYEHYADADQALPFAERALAAAKEAGDAAQTAKSAYFLGYLHEHQAHYQQAFLAYYDSYLYYETAGDVLWMGNSQRSLAWLYTLGEMYPEAKKHFEQAEALFATLEDASHLMKLKKMEADYERRQGHTQEALDLYTQLIPYYESQSDYKSATETNIWIGDLHRQAGNFEQALNHFEQATAFAELLGDGAAIKLATIQHHRGQVAAQQGQWENAIDLYAQAHPVIFQHGYAGRGIAVAHDQLDALLASGATAEALALTETVKPWLAQTTDHERAYAFSKAAITLAETEAAATLVAELRTLSENWLVVAEEQQAKMDQLRAAYELELAQNEVLNREIATAQLQQRWQWAAIMLLLLLLGGAVVTALVYRHRQLQLAYQQSTHRIKQVDEGMDRMADIMLEMLPEHRKS